MLEEWHKAMEPYNGKSPEVWDEKKAEIEKAQNGTRYARIIEPILKEITGWREPSFTKIEGLESILESVT